jgi:hypothetical protein
MINEWLAIMYSHIHTCNALFDFFFFFFLCYLSKTMTKAKKNQNCDKISSSVVETFYCD